MDPQQRRILAGPGPNGMALGGTGPAAGDSPEWVKESPRHVEDDYAPRVRVSSSARRAVSVLGLAGPTL